jgi:hypothetical protein
MRSLRCAGGAGVSTSTLGLTFFAEAIPRRRSQGMPEGRGGRKLSIHYIAGSGPVSYLPGSLRPNRSRSWSASPAASERLGSRRNWFGAE